MMKIIVYGVMGDLVVEVYAVAPPTPGAHLSQSWMLSRLQTGFSPEGVAGAVSQAVEEALEHVDETGQAPEHYVDL